MRIILATEFFPDSATGEITGGVESRAFFVARELAKKHKVYVLTSRRLGQEKEASFLGLKIYRVGPQYPYTQTGSLLKRLFFSLAAIIKANKLIRQEGIEVVDGYNFFTYPLPLLACGRRLKRFLTYHEVWLGNWSKNTDKRGFFGEIAERKVLLLAGLSGIRLIAVSEFTRQALIKNGISPNKVGVIQNGVMLSDYSKIPAKKARQLTICYVGRLTKNKRIEDLIAAMPLIKKEIASIRCLIVGSGPEEASLRQLAERLNVSKEVEFTGYLPSHEAVLEKLKSSHIFCSPSIVEGFGITLVEAIACNVPFVCSDIEPFKEISQSKGGLHFKRQQPKDLAAKVILLLKSRILYEKMAKEEKALAKRFDWQEITSKIEEEYQR